MVRPALTFVGPLHTLFPHGLSGIIFDCDGVMIDSAPANRFLYNAILGALGLPPITPEQERFAFQATFQQALEHLVPQHLHGRMEQAAREAVDYDRDIVPKIKLMAGFREFAESAHDHGLKLAMDTNRTDAGARKILDFFHLPSYFDPVVSCTTAPPKPSPVGAELIARTWEVAPSQVLFVGDSPDDGAAARGAHMVFAGFGGLGGDITVSSWAALGEMLWEGDSAPGPRGG